MRRVTIIAISILTLSTAANAEFYAGVDGHLTMIDWKGDLPTRAEHTGGLGVLAGYRHGSFAGELSWSTTANDYGDRKNAGTDYINHLTVTTAAFDGFAYVPLPVDWIQPFVTAGAGYAFGKDRQISRWDATEIIEGSITPQKPYGETHIVHHKLVTLDFGTREFLWRVGAGVAVQLSHDLTFRTTGRYEPYDFGGRSSGGFSFGIGLLVRT